MTKYLTEEACSLLWNGRSSIWIEGFTLVRLRVAFRYTDILWQRWSKMTSKKPFHTYVFNYLDDLRRAGTPHMLQHELMMVVKALQKGDRRHHVYARFCYHRARRSVSNLKYGGRRGS